MTIITRSSACRTQQLEKPMGSAVSEQSPPEPEIPSVQPLTPIPTEHDAADAALVATRLYLPVLIKELSNVSKECPGPDTLKHYLLQFPDSNRQNLLAFLETLIQCCKEVNTADQHNNRHTPAPTDNSTQPIVCCNNRYSGGIEDILTNTPTLAEIQSENEFEASQPPEEVGSDEEDTAKPEDEPQESQPSENSQSEDEPQNSRLLEEAAESEHELDQTTKSPWNWDGYTDVPTLEATEGLAQEYTRKARNPDGHDVETDQVLRGFVDLPCIAKGMVDKRAISPPTASSGPGTAVLESSHNSPSKETTITTTTTLVGSSSCDTPTKGRATTPESTISKASKEPYWTLITQSDIKFAAESIEQVRGFGISGNSPGTYKHLFLSLRAGKSQTTYSDGSEWINVVKAGFKDRQKSSVLYALTAIAFCRWHADQAELAAQTSGETLRAAKQTVTARVLSTDQTSQSTRDQCRKSLNTHLTRGRKWSLLVGELGFGILFKYTW